MITRKGRPRIESLVNRSLGPGGVYEWMPVAQIMEQLDEFMSGDTVLAGFSGGTMIVMAGVIDISALLLVFSSRRILFPRLMNLISKTERIDGRSLLAPASGLDDWILGIHASNRLAGSNTESDMGFEGSVEG